MVLQLVENNKNRWGRLDVFKVYGDHPKSARTINFHYWVSAEDQDSVSNGHINDRQRWRKMIEEPHSSQLYKEQIEDSYYFKMSPQSGL